MKEVKLRMNEQEKYEVIKELVDHNGNNVNGKIKCRNSVKNFVGFPTFFIC